MGSRYERNILVKDFGAAGQAALQNARIGVLGAGGLGSPILYYLAAAGAGYLKVVDFDAVEESNLQRQILHDTARIGRRKAESAARTLRTLNPEITVDAICERVGKHNAARIFGDVDVVVEASDNMETKFMLADYCETSGQPLVWGSAVGMQAMVTTFTSRPLAADPSGKTATLRELYPQFPDPQTTPTATTQGVLGPLVGVAGSLMAMEVIKIVCDTPGVLVRRLALVDVRETGVRLVEF